MSNKKQKTVKNRPTNKGEAGFSMLEVVVAIFILTTALIGTAAALTFALEFGAISKNVSNGKLVIVSSIEEIESLRNSHRLEFKQIENDVNVDNTGSPNPFTGFLQDFQPVTLTPGPDGVNGTADDLLNPGPDDIYGTADDFNDQSLIRTGYSRKIEITELPTTKTVKKVTVTVRYFGAGGKVGEISGVAYLNNESRLTR